jgi:hypothetical protein
MNEEPLDMSVPKPFTDEENLKSLQILINSAPNEEVRQNLEQQIIKLKEIIENG